MIFRALLTALTLCLVYSGMISRFPGGIRRRGATTHQANCVRVEQLVHADRIPENIVVGSSLFDMLQPDMLGPEFGSLAVAGGSTRTGLEILYRSRLKPKRVYIETNFLPKEPDPELLAYLYDEPMATLRAMMPVLRQSHQPVNLLFSLIQSRRTPSEIVSVPRQLEAALRHHLRVASEDGGPQDTRPQLETVRERVQSLQASGTEVLFVEMPVHPSLAASARPSALRAQVESFFPPARERWLKAAPDESYATSDGLHLVTADARRFASKVRATAGLKPLQPATASNQLN